MSREVFESVGLIYKDIPDSPAPPPSSHIRRSSSSLETSEGMNESEDGRDSLRSEAIDLILSWVNYF
jgi:hypothetical protein